MSFGLTFLDVMSTCRIVMYENLKVDYNHTRNKCQYGWKMMLV